MTLRNVLLLAAALCALGGCASLPNKDPIQVTVAGLESLPEEGEGAEIRMLVKLRVQNPNASPIDFSGAYVKLDVLHKTFASGVTSEGATVPAFAETIVAVRADSGPGPSVKRPAAAREDRRMSAPTPDGAEAADSGRAESFRSNLGRLLLLTLLFYMNFMARIVQAPLMPAIENDLNITHAEAGSLFSILSIGYFITLIGSGFVSARLTHRWTLVLSIGCAGGTLLATAASEGVWGIRFGLFLTGLSTGLYLPSAIAA